MTQLHSEVFDGDSGLLILLHGLGATFDVWSPVVAARPESFTGRIIVMDLPGHGASEHLDDYGIKEVAKCIVDTLHRKIENLQRCVLLGHSYGGVLALELMHSRWELNPQSVFGLGIKTLWTREELARMNYLAEKIPKRFSSEQGAIEWYQKTTGLAGITGGSANFARHGVRQSADGQWMLALDAKVNKISEPDMDRLMSHSTCPVSLAYGAHDHMVDTADLRRYDPDVRNLAGGGHNIMVTHPEVIWTWMQSCWQN
ncbi:MAG: alpha/beta hydrolase [Woeseia sp.]|nr:alpha/beta hydrolase [Woeseia sp.]